MRIFACLAGLSIGCWAQAAQPSPNPGFRLAFARRIFVDSLGDSDAAKIVRDQIVAAILNRTGISVESTRAQADAVLTGTAVVTSGRASYAVGTASATRNTASAQIAASSSTILITQLGLQLTDAYGRILWAYDGSRCLDKTTLLLFGVPRKKSATACAAEQLAKAIDRDAKAAR